MTLSSRIHDRKLDCVFSYFKMVTFKSLVMRLKNQTSTESMMTNELTNVKKMNLIYTKENAQQCIKNNRGLLTNQFEYRYFAYFVLSLWKSARQFKVEIVQQ